MIKTKVEIKQSSVSKLWNWIVSREVVNDNSTYYVEVARSNGYVNEVECKINLNYMTEAFKNETAKGKVT